MDLLLLGSLLILSLCLLPSRVVRSRVRARTTTNDCEAARRPVLRPGSVLVEVGGARVGSGGPAPDVGLTMVPGEVVVVIGPDGVGKTAFVNALSNRADGLADGVAERRAHRLLTSVGLARAVAESPRLLVLDEPFGGLDAEEREDLASHIRRLRAAGVWVVVIDHVLDDLVAVADRVVALDVGQTAAEEASFGEPRQTLLAERL